MNVFTIILFALSVNVASAKESVFFMKIPTYITTTEAITALTKAAVKRKWTVDELKKNKLHINLNHHNYKAVLDFSFTEHEIYYSDLTTYFHSDEIDDNEEKWTGSAAPKNWALNLKSDVNSYFSLIKMNNKIKGTYSHENIKIKLENLKKTV